ncbi:hypothetical protein ACQKIY_25595 [Bacillus mycoides]|uniref:hypothetical protein n=1 Tax=Bacillus mycoides TaxID=1405 RepID=UPI003D029C75
MGNHNDIIVNKPKLDVHQIQSFDGRSVCEYVAHKLNIDIAIVEDTISEHMMVDKEYGLDGMLVELIIEEEEYCNDEGTYYDIKRVIAEDFGGHININFLNSTAYM